MNGPNVTGAGVKFSCGKRFHRVSSVIDSSPPPLVMQIPSEARNANALPPRAHPQFRMNMPRLPEPRIGFHWLP